MPDTIKALYPIALAEGEGVGTAYEYVAKARFLRPLSLKLGRSGPTGRVLVAGLPEKYGVSLDFALLAERSGAALEIADERPEAIERAARAIEQARRDGWLAHVQTSFRQLGSLDEVASLPAQDAVVCCEVLQRLPPERRPAFAEALRALAPVGAVFVPNAENGAHLKISGLGGFTLAELAELFRGARLAYVDMPPFPPGIVRSPEQRAKASTGALEWLAMRALDAYCAAEPWAPKFVKRRAAHIVCALWGA
jgi:hypothetical protein